MQYGVRPGPDSLLEPLLLIVAGACAGALLLPLTRLVVTRARGRSAAGASRAAGCGRRPPLKRGPGR